MGTEFIDGLAFHWYNGGNDRLLDGTYGFEAIRATHKKFPQKILLATEGCSCPGILLGDWFRGERLAHDVIFDLNNWANGWIDWNLIVDRFILILLFKSKNYVFFAVKADQIT